MTADEEVMEFKCIGACSAKVKGKQNIPQYCRCGMKGVLSYYPTKYLMDFANWYAKVNQTSVSDGYITAIKELRIKYKNNNGGVL